MEKRIEKQLPDGPYRCILAVSCLACFGLVLSIYLTYMSIRHLAVPCSVTGGGCSLVAASRYSHILGFPVSGLGIFFYLLMLVLSLWLVIKPAIRHVRMVFVLSVLGLLFSIYLSSLEEFVIHAWCAWCIVSALLTVTIFILLLLLITLFGKAVKSLT